VVEQHREDGLILRASGELCIATEPKLRRAVERSEASASVIVLDLQGLTHLDSTGLALLVMLDRRAAHGGFRLAIVPPRAPVDSPIHLSGLDEALPFVATPEEAFEEPRGGPPGRLH
jgi:anti-anti-sigma factor